MKRKQSIYKGLQFIPIWFEDRSLTSPDYFQISEFPNKLTAGKNLFKLRGNPTNLAINSSLDIEILDYNNNPIYHEILNYIDDDKSRIVAIYIYDDTAAGDCSITITAQSKIAPESWKDIPNIRWTRTVSVNPNISNESEIIFETIPDITITEQIGPHLDRIYSGSLQFPIANTGTVKYFSYNGQPAIQLSGSEFTKDMSNGTIVVNTPINPTPTPRYTPNTTKYVSTIKKVLSPTLALLDNEYEVYSSSSLEYHTYYAFDESPYELTYEATPTYIETQNSESYALIEIKGLQPATGDVSRIKLFMNNKGTIGTWESISDTELAETEIFVSSTSSIYPDTSIGLFTSQSVINTYWEGHTYQGFIESTTPTLTWNTASLNNAMQISNSIDISANNSVTVVQTKSTYAGTFIKNSDYKLTIDALGVKNNYNTAILSVYLSGSAFSMDYTDYFNQELPVKLGRKIGEISVTGNSQRFDDTVFKFTSDNTGIASLLFVVESGDWQISDIRTTSDNDTGYTPNYTRIKTLVPTAHKSNNQLSFKAEYYNVTGAKSKQISYLYNKLWEGGNRYIDGDYSMLTGSLYVADSLQSGVAISGYKNTGFIRSLGYEGFAAGFPGFLMWSGSALSGSSGTKGGVDYSGVGLELYANTDNYLRYSTTDSELDIRTDNIFIGNNTTFISASNGNIKISGSNIDLNTEKFFLGNSTNFISGSNGNIKISGSNVSVTTPTVFLGNNDNFISASNGNIRISGSNVSVNTPTVFLGNSTNFISASNGNIRISGSNVSVSAPTVFLGNSTNFISASNGNIKISGSNVSVSTPTFFLGTPNTQFISGSNGNLQISASNFSITAQGNVSASNIFLNNVAYADGFVFSTVIVNDSNYTNYYEEYEINGLNISGSLVSRKFIKLILDGSKGGQAASQVRLQRQPDYPIGMIIPPGYQAASTNGYTLTIENWVLTAGGQYGAVYLANAVASGSNIYDFGIHCDVWDKHVHAFTAQEFGAGDIRIISGSETIKYGENFINGPYGSRLGTYSLSGVAQSQVLPLSYGNTIQLQRTVSGSSVVGNQQSSFWHIMNTDDNRYLRQYFGGMKIGNGGVHIGGNGSLGSTGATVHFTTMSLSAVLQLDARTDSVDGDRVVFIPPRVEQYIRDNVANPIPGSIIFNTDTNKLQVYAAGAWVNLH